MEYTKINLPSLGLAYKNFEKFEIRSLTGADEERMAAIATMNVEKKFAELIKSCTRGVDPYDLTLGDKLFILLYLTIDTFGKDYPGEFYCEHCFQKLYQNFDLNAFDVIALPDNFEQPCPIELSSGKQLYLRLRTVRDEVEVIDAELSKKNGYLLRYALTVVDQTKDIDQKLELLRNMPKKDFDKVKAFHEKYQHGPVMEAKYHCELCGGDGVVAVPFRIEMLFPTGSAIAKRLGETV